MYWEVIPHCERTSTSIVWYCAAALWRLLLDLIGFSTSKRIDSGGISRVHSSYTGMTTVSMDLYTWSEDGFARKSEALHESW